MLKYCVAQVNLDLNGPRVSYYAATPTQGIYRVEDLNDPNLTWYDSQEEALARRMNANDCVVPRQFDGLDALWKVANACDSHQSVSRAEAAFEAAYVTAKTIDAEQFDELMRTVAYISRELYRR